jgi:CBS domain-containing protein
MNTTKNALGTLKARDIMRSNVFKLEPTSTVEEAVTSFAELHISGAPVVDRNGRLVGVLSAFDIARPENLRNGRLAGSGGE